MSTTTLNNINDCRCELVINISQVEFSKFYQESLAKVQKNVKMPGFRPGKVPVNIIKAQYGASLQMESEENAANNYLREYLEANEVQLVGQPALTDVKENEDKSHTYKIEFDIIPDFNLGDYKSIVVYEPTHSVTDAEIEKEVQIIAKQLGKRENIEQVADFESQIVIDSYRINPETKETLAGVESEKNIIIDLAQVKIEDLKQLLLNAKVGDNLVYEPKNQAENQNLVPEKIVVKEIFKIIPAELNEEFAKKASEERFDNMEDFKQEIGFKMQKFWDDRTRQELELQVGDKLIEMHENFSIPQALLKVAREQIENDLKKRNADFNNEHVKKYIVSQSEKLVRLELVRDKIIEKEKLEVEDYDIENFADKYFAGLPAQQNSAVSRESLAGFIKNDERTMRMLLHNKLMDLLLDFATTNEVTFEEYNKRLNDEVAAEIEAENSAKKPVEDKTKTILAEETEKPAAKKTRKVKTAAEKTAKTETNNDETEETVTPAAKKPRKSKTPGGEQLEK